jgi:Carboxypeptidase regulatory-like domain
MSSSQSGLNFLPLLLILFAGHNLAAEPGCIEGKVLDAAGAPVPSIYAVAIGANHKWSIEVQTDSDGFFKFDQLLAGEEYDVLASDKSFDSDIDKSEMGAVHATAASESQCPRVTLLQRARAHLHVRATDMITGEPVKSVNAHFRLDSDNSWRGCIDEHGELLVPPGSDLGVQVGAAGYETSGVLRITTPQPDEADEVAVEMRPVQMGCIDGTVLDLEGRGVPGADIQTSSGPEDFQLGTRTSADANGQFRVGGIQPANYWIFVNATGYPPSLTRIIDRVPVPPGPNCASATVRLGPKAAKLRVTVINGMTQEPIMSAVVWLNGEFKPQGGWSLRVGRVVSPVPALTQFTVTARAESYETAQPLTISPMQPGETREVTIALTPKSLR